MMINKRLIGTVKESKKYIAGNVICQWVSLAANITMMGAIARMLQSLFSRSAGDGQIVLTAVIAATAVVIRFVCNILSARMGYLSSKAVKKTLRELIYKKLLRLGTSYKEQANTSEVVQVAVEGVDQLETYFGAYLPQFFYAMLAPLTLFVVLSFVNFPSAIVLLVCVPLIPVTIIMVQRWAKKLLAKYWGQYTALGDTFLENLQGLTTTKIYQADEFKHKEMNEQSEHFRKITIKVLTMQLNSITIMDLIAYGGAALGVILATTQFRAGHVNLAGCILIILLAADFFLPMRMLGSFFHIAMNGMAASDKIFRLLDLPEPEQKTQTVPEDCSIECRGLCFSYDADREILHGVDMAFPKGSFTAIVGESGCGKSTIAAILMGRNKGYSGSITVGGVPLSEISEGSLMANFTYISHQSYLFKGTVRDNLLMARPNAGEDTLWQVLERVNLADFLRSEKGLDTMLNEKATNLSGGQCQRLALARALLHDSPVYIFDEATSNIDVESENDIIVGKMERIKFKKEMLLEMRTDGEITKQEFLDQRKKLDKELQELQAEYDSKAHNPLIEMDQPEWGKIQTALEEILDLSQPTPSPDLIRKFVAQIVPEGKTNFQWHLNLDGNQTTHVGMTVEGRKNKAVVSFAAEGTCSPLAFGAVIEYPTLCRAATDKNAYLSAMQDRLLSRMAGTKELPEVCQPNREKRGRESVHVRLEQ